MPRNYSRFLQVIATWITILFPVWLVAGHVAADGALSAIALLFLLHCTWEKNWRWCAGRWVQCLFLLWFYIVLRGIFAEDPVLALHRSLPFVRYFVFAAALTYWLFQDSTTRRRFFMTLAIALLFLSLDGLLQWFTGNDIFRRPIIIDPSQHLRLTGPYTKPILGIMLAWLAFPACLQFLIPENGTAQRIGRVCMGIILTLLILAVIVLSGERMALLLTLLGGLIALLLLPVRKACLFAALIAGVLLIGAIAFISPQVLSRQVHSTVYTLEHWQESPYGLLFTSDLALAATHPVFGIGSNQFNVTCQSLFTASPTSNPQSCNTHPHNIYMEWLIENGLVGFVLFISLLAIIFRMCCQSWPANRLNPVFIGLLISFIMRVWPIASSTNFFSSWGSPPFWLVLGILLSYTVGKEARHADTPLAVQNAGI